MRISLFSLGLLVLLPGATGGCASTYQAPNNRLELAAASNPETGPAPDVAGLDETDSDSDTVAEIDADADAAPGIATRTYRQTRAGFNKAATAPLEDLNVRRDPIPKLLLNIKNPYAVPVDADCDALATQIDALNALLGRDWDVPPPDKTKLSERAAEGASTAFLETVASEASGLIPYRGVVRSLSGAERHRTKRRKAFERGSHRRTFLKGLGMAKNCPYPASPQPLPELEKQAKIEFR